jgi:hypothetical protein
LIQLSRGCSVKMDFLMEQNTLKNRQLMEQHALKKVNSC